MVRSPQSAVRPRFTVRSRSGTLYPAALRTYNAARLQQKHTYQWKNMQIISLKTSQQALDCCWRYISPRDGSTKTKNTPSLQDGSVWFSSIWFWFQIENWKSKIHNRDFQCLIPQELKITNLQSQSSIFVSKRHKIEKQFSMFWKSKIENWKWSVGGFYFLFLRKRKTKR